MADLTAAAVAGLGALGIAVLHVADVGHDLAQERLRVRDQLRFAGDRNVRGLTRLVQPLGQWWLLSLVAAVAVLACVLSGRRRRAGVLVVVTAAVLVVVATSKVVIVHPAVDAVHGVAIGSFPSGHTADVTAILGTVLVVLTPIRLRLLPYAVALVGGVVVGSSRVLSGAHTPDDVTAGWLLGAFLILAAGGWLARAEAPAVRSERDAEQRVGQPADQPGG